jgi:hypothetical protein
MKMILALIGFVFVGCEPAYRCLILNDMSQNAVITTKPSLVDYFFGDHKEHYKRINQSESLKAFTHTLNPNDTIEVYGKIGSKIPTERNFPFYYLSVVVGNDTTVINSRKQIIRCLKEKATRIPSTNYFSTSYLVKLSDFCDSSSATEGKRRN